MLWWCPCKQCAPMFIFFTTWGSHSGAFHPCLLLTGKLMVPGYREHRAAGPRCGIETTGIGTHVINTIFLAAAPLCDLELGKNKSQCKLSWIGSVAVALLLSRSFCSFHNTLCCGLAKISGNSTIAPYSTTSLSPVCFLEVTSQALPHFTA